MTSVSGVPIEMSLEEIDRDESLRLLGTQRFGRLAIADHGYYPPHIVPVGFVLAGDAVVFRSDVGLKFKLSILAEHSVSFEVDSVDSEGRMAWSVVVQGRAQLLSDDEVAAGDFDTSFAPWAPSGRDNWVKVVPYTITGRRLRARPIAPAC